MLRLVAKPFGWIGNQLAARIIGALVFLAAPLMIVQDFLEGQRMDMAYWSSVSEVLWNCVELMLVARTS
jgi:hypothetical protein